MSRNEDYIKAAFAIYEEALNAILQHSSKKVNPDLFDKLMGLNARHLIDNLDKALVLFKDKEKE